MSMNERDTKPLLIHCLSHFYITYPLYANEGLMSHSNTTPVSGVEKTESWKYVHYIMYRLIKTELGYFWVYIFKTWIIFVFWHVRTTHDHAVKLTIKLFSSHLCGQVEFIYCTVIATYLGIGWNRFSIFRCSIDNVWVPIVESAILILRDRHYFHVL